MSEQENGQFAKREEEVLAFWNKHKIFEKSLAKPSPNGQFIFYDGPPFANGPIHYGHILTSVIKDALPRYRTMRGYHVSRRWGWDCHGLPVENFVEKELGFKTKRDIEEFGIDKFNIAARNGVLRHVAEWKRDITRIGRWADMENSYKTMDTDYTESVWWAFKNLYDRGLIYEGFKAMHLCPRCGTTLSNFEVAQGYKDVDDYAVTVKFPLVDEPNTSLLIWTTTTWTLPGNVAIAVNADAIYVKVKVGKEFVIVAKERLSTLQKSLQTLSEKSSDLAPSARQTFLQEFANSSAPEIEKELVGKELVGKYYTPPFDYFKGSIHHHKTHAFRVYSAPFVTLDSGTGIVHIAPAFGADDLALAQKEKIPLIHHVTDDGKFIATVTDFAQLSVKPKGRHMETDVKIIEHLDTFGILFAKEKINHSYPHCWRCETPLLNWASNSWFVKVSALKSKLLAENKKVDWVPEHIGTGRFHKGIGSAPDWAISRSRYWGAPIPVWQNTKTKEIKVMGSVEELLALTRRSGNQYFVMRHGESESNVKNILNSNNSITFSLTENGKQGVLNTVQKLHAYGIDMIITSPLVRTRETASIVQKELNLPDSAVMVDERLREVSFGIFEGGSLDMWKASYTSFGDRFIHASEGGETYIEVRRRVGDCLFETERRYAHKKILFVTHDGPAGLLYGVSKMRTLEEAETRDQGDLLRTSEVKELPFVSFPHNEDFELDLHRPYIDNVVFGNYLSGTWKRISHVFDCWFESGAMPFASNHYPFKKNGFDPKRMFGLFPKGYPANFIAEGLDQTRGWFYSLIVLGTALFGKAPYKNVIVNGLILASDGQKMSKRLKNYPDPMDVVSKFGADALRYYLLSSPITRGEDLKFSIRGVEEVSKKLLMRLYNVRAFYDLYSEGTVSANGTSRGNKSMAVLDQWILSRLGELVRDTTSGFEKYELDLATRPLAGFIDDLSTWYIRRSRDRFKKDGEDKTQALATTRFVLYTLAQVMAPVLPFFAEDLYKSVKEECDEESVHLSKWPTEMHVHQSFITGMVQVRAICSQGLELREKAGIKVRQPLARLSVKVFTNGNGFGDLIAEEVNVKEVVVNSTQVDEVVLDTMLTPELRDEGIVRDMVRMIQEFRKKEGLSIGDRPVLTITTTAEGEIFFKKHKNTLIAETGLANMFIIVETSTEEDTSLKLSGLQFPVRLMCKK